MSKESKTQEFDPLKDPRLVVQKIGVWTLLKERKGRFDRIHPRATLNQLYDLYAPCKRLIIDIYKLEPGYLAMYLFYRLWVGIEPVVLLYFTSSILKAIEVSLKGQTPDVKAIGFAVAAHLICVALTSALKSLDAIIDPRLRSSITAYFEENFLQCKLVRDLPTSQANNSFSHINGEKPWETFQTISSYATSMVTAIAQLLFISQSSTLPASNSLFAVVCLVYPMADTLLTDSFWNQDVVWFASDETYKRMKSLQDLNRREFKKDILSGDITDYVIAEHTLARESLRGTPTVPIWDLESQLAAGWHILLGFLSDLPIVYYAVQAVLYPSQFSMTTVAVLQQSHTSLRSTFSMLVNMWSWLRRQVGSLKHLYSMLDMVNSIVDGERSYPNPSEEKSKGMALELRNVAFAYPASQSDSDALNDVSVSIEPGSLVVVVGTNGSGKSTLVNILTRLYDVKSGKVLIDGHPIQEYQLSDLREATAVLTQDHELFPLSLYENIGVGNSSLIGDDERVKEAARQGGAADVVAKFKEGMDTVLEPYHGLYAHMSAGAPKDHPLNNAIRALSKDAAVSGGEKQRLVASRMFMRFSSDKIRLVCVDEPSSALDPEAEFQLFNNLRRVREGKTMIFITHRFGHLARYADLILYMKDGKIIERGTHEELMKENGGYAYQYNIQASAFQENGKD